MVDETLEIDAFKPGIEDKGVCESTGCMDDGEPIVEVSKRLSGAGSIPRALFSLICARIYKIHETISALEKNTRPSTP